MGKNQTTNICGQFKSLNHYTKCSFYVINDTRLFQNSTTPNVPESHIEEVIEFHPSSHL